MINPSVGLHSFLETVRIAHSGTVQLLNQPAQAEVTRFLGDVAAAEGLPSRLCRELASGREFKVASGIRRMEQIASRNADLGRRLSESLVPDGIWKEPLVLGALLLDSSLMGPDKKTGFSLPLLCGGLSLPQETGLLRRWNLVDPLLEKYPGLVEQCWDGLEKKQIPEERALSCADVLLLLARKDERYPDPILGPIKPPNVIERYHPTKTYLFRPVFLRMGGRYRPFPAYMTAGAVSYVAHFILFLPLLYVGSTLPTLALSCTLFLYTHFYRAWKAHGRLIEGKERFTRELRALQPGLPEIVRKRMLELSLQAEKAEYIQIKKELFSSRR